MAKAIKEIYHNYAGARVREEMLKQNLSTTQLQKMTGVHRTTIAKWIYDGIDISSMRAMKLCNALGISMDYVFGLERKKNG